jgi:hypothetical protein
MLIFPPRRLGSQPTGYTDRSSPVNKSFIVALLALFLTESLTAADASGVWSLRLTTADGESAPRTTVTLKQEGTTLTGTCVIGDTDATFTVTGQAIEDVVTWRCASGGPVEASFKGTINSTGREITGSWTTPAPANGTFKGSKKQD